MAVSVNREGGPDGDIDYVINVASGPFYQNVWYPVSKKLGVKLFLENGQFTKEQVPEVMRELELLNNWAKINLTGDDLEYMTSRIENLKQKIPGAFDKDDTILYIY